MDRNKLAWIVVGLIVLVFIGFVAYVYFDNKRFYDELAKAPHADNIPGITEDSADNILVSPEDKSTKIDYSTLIPETIDYNPTFLDSKRTPGPFAFTGQYEVNLEMLSGFLCFRPDKATEKFVPRPAGDERLGWFCFRNNLEAFKILGMDKVGELGKDCIAIKGEASIRTKDHQLFIGDTAGADLMTLTEVTKMVKAPTCIKNDQ